MSIGHQHEQRIEHCVCLQYYTYNDLAIGIELTMYGRTFRLVNADGFTLRFYSEKLGVELGPPLNSSRSPCRLLVCSHRQMALITSDCNSMHSLRTKWP